MGGRPADPMPMVFRAIGIALLAVSLSGCWVMDEIDASSKKLDLYTGKSAKQAAEEEAAAKRAAEDATKKEAELLNGCLQSSQG